MFVRSFRNVPEAFPELLHIVKTIGRPELSRNGAVIAMPEPVGITIRNPQERVLTCPVRDANPFFHAMEFVWMMAGSKDAQWISQFNKNMMTYSDDGRVINAAYGFRWQSQFGYDQVWKAIQMLRKNPNDRRVLISMWDPYNDFGSLSKDIPCNTQIMLRAVDGHLNMMVTNRSNDLVWGMMGANAVHMTLLHEVIAAATALPLGEYSVMSNNLHMYENVPNFKTYMNEGVEVHSVYGPDCTHIPVLSGTDYFLLREDCQRLTRGLMPVCANGWVEYVAMPIYNAWMDRKDGRPFIHHVEDICATDWRIACQQWLERRQLKNTETPSPSSDGTLSA